MQLEVGCVHIPRFFAKQNSNFTKAFLMMITLLLLNVGCQEIKNTSKGMNAFSIQNHHDQKLVNMMCDMSYFDPFRRFAISSRSID